MQYCALGARANRHSGESETSAYELHGKALPRPMAEWDKELGQDPSLGNAEPDVITIDSDDDVVHEWAAAVAGDATPPSRDPLDVQVVVHQPQVVSGNTVIITEYRFPVLLHHKNYTINKIPFS